LLLLEPHDRWGVVLLMNASGLLANLGPYQALEAGVVDQLAGRPAPAAAALSLNALYLIIDSVLLLLSSSVLWRLLRLRRWDPALGQRQGRIAWIRRVVVPLLLEWPLPLALLGGVWLLFSVALGARWDEILLFVPDLAWWLVGISALLLLTGAIRVWLALQALRRTVDQRSVATSPISG
jgi:hypothetical protein